MFSIEDLAYHGDHQEGGRMRRTQCPNKELHGGGWYQQPDMVRIYIRTSTQEEIEGSWQKKTKRKWEPIGVICPDEKCRRVILDETGEKEEEG
jgi:hypothetical protein